MKNVSIGFDLLCDWSGTEPTYRIYFDQELLTERDYRWDNQRERVRENISVIVGEGSHQLVIVNLDPDHSRFWIKNTEIQGIEPESLTIKIS
jgi:hypothetical protein